MARKRDDKGRSKRRDHKNHKAEESSDSDSVLNDAASVVSNASGAEDIDEVPPTVEAAPEEEVPEVDDFDSKLDQVFDNLQSAKSAKSRAMQYESLAKALTTRFCSEYLDTRKVTVQDILEHGLKHSDDEAGFAAHVVSLILVTMGNSDFSDAVFRELFDILNRTMMDTTAKPFVRSKCATALSVGCFITDYGMEKTSVLLGQLLAVGYTTVKGHPDANQLNAIHAMKAVCLDMFSFLVSIESDEYKAHALGDNIVQLAACLDSPNLALRVAAGECIALLLEKARDVNEDYRFAHADLVRSKLQALATDSQKSRSKKELREQRSNFRQILRTVEGDDFGEETVRFGQERAIIESWQSKRYYDTFCSVLGSGMPLHLVRNGTLRDIFDLGPIVDNGLPLKVSKVEKNFINNINRKAREISRGKQRGKRADYDV